MKKLILILTIPLIYGCGQSNPFSNNKTLSDFIDINNVEKAEVSNNYGTFFLNTKQLNHLKIALKNLSFEPNQDIKVGGKAVSITINNEEYWLVTRTNGEMAEITIDNETLVFKTNGLNLDNYKK